MCSRYDSANHYTFSRAQSGEMVPAILNSVHEKKPLHSMVNPQREAQRLASSIPDSTLLVVLLGLGGGFTAEAILSQTQAQLVVIDYNKEGIKELFSVIDYSRLVNNKRFSLLIDPDADEIKCFLLQNYNPSLCGGIKTIPLRARTEAEPLLFENAVRAIQETVDIISSDYSVQVHFGRRWFSNIIRNIKDFEPSMENKLPCSITGAAIAAAGPSLNQQMPFLSELKSKQVFIISCDTALPVLLQNGIEPDTVVSIDCQHISYHHFFGYSNIKNIYLALDIASPPLLSRLPFHPVFFSSSHPLAQYISAVWQPLFQIDTSGGNVTYACLSLAETIGAKNITLFGADFAYIRSGTYAKGTYVNPYFDKKQNRFLSLEAQSSAFLYRSEFLPKTSQDQSYRETSSLRFYREKFEKKAAETDAHITCAKGEGAPVKIQNRLTDNAIRNASLPKTKRNSITGSEFLDQYRKNIAALPEAGEDDYLHKLDKNEREIFTTLLPTAAFIKYRNPSFKANDLIEETKRYCVELIRKVI
ncbi:MAG: DUF115 domain-containing protein [Treponema sp.]|nr:DUF115 domain-containing protein [Treponema sp.]MCL2272263.1 DUF115 domain-containing protein [Treponema sp.]